MDCGLCPSQVAEIEDKLEKMHMRIVNARKQHEFFRRLAANTELGLRQLFLAGALQKTPPPPALAPAALAAPSPSSSPSPAEGGVLSCCVFPTASTPQGTCSHVLPGSDGNLTRLTHALPRHNTTELAKRQDARRKADQMAGKYTEALGADEDSIDLFRRTRAQVGTPCA
eukprot:COSAG05_NODE_602_length_8420_cov_13.540199_7_plen_170_part_00